MPTEMPNDNSAPQQQSGKDDTQYTVGCLWEAKSNSVVLLWGPTGRAVVEPTRKQGQEPLTIGGLPGLKAAEVDSSGLLTCMAKIDLGEPRGVFGVVVRQRTQTQPPDQQPCLVATRLATTVVDRTV